MVRELHQRPVQTCRLLLPDALPKLHYAHGYPASDEKNVREREAGTEHVWWGRAQVVRYGVLANVRWYTKIAGSLSIWAEKKLYSYVKAMEKRRLLQMLQQAPSRVQMPPNCTHHVREAPRRCREPKLKKFIVGTQPL